MHRSRIVVLFFATFASGFCGMIAEYSLATTVGHLVGNSITAYTVGIGVFMLAMGIGGLLSRQLAHGRELELFLFTEAALSVSCAASTVFVTQAAPWGLTWPSALFMASLVGLLIGFEIPLLMRFNERQKIVLKDNVALILGADYIGAFVAGVSFALFFIDRFGLVLTPVISGGVNLLIALVMGLQYRALVPAWKTALLALPAGTCLLSLAAWGEGVVFSAEQRLFRDPIVFHTQTPYQQIIITQKKQRRCLFLNGATQFCSQDERRYHELLVHPAMWLNQGAKRVLILGGGDGLAAREVLKYEGVHELTLVDLDPHMLELARSHSFLAELNEGALSDERVQLVAADAFTWLMETPGFWDAILVDLPDPSRVELSKLYSLQFYQLLRNHLAPQGVAAVQSTSPVHATLAFVTIWRTLQAAGLNVLPYRFNVPSIGDWGFNLATRSDHLSAEQMRQALDRFEERVPTQVVNQQALQAATRFEKGILPADPSSIEVSLLVRPRVFEAYRRHAWELE